MSAPVVCCGQIMVNVEIRGVYDGTLYRECDVCGKRAHRFASDTPMYAKAEPYVSAGAVRGTT